ncbi:AbrB/MazE/SpoVT family DNA-binding domain-containing protein [Candidatus Woesearchaeota archaeon]|nr:AbrB/MazE/SpoVT family DNA-binding domain-containing protein [Candidatus Woesearchaeota archaeon]
MRRRLIRQGQTTLMVSIPARWAKARNLGKGAEVEIAEKEGDLIISAEGKDIKREAAFSLASAQETSVRTAVTNAYRLGFDRVTIDLTGETQFPIVQKTVRDLLPGFDVVSHGEGRCIIENITEPSAERADAVFRKILYSIEEIYSLVRRHLQGSDVTAGILEVEATIQRYDNFCRRIASKSADPSEPTQLLWAFYTGLVHGQREVFLLVKRPAKASQETLALFDGMSKLFVMLKEGYIKKDLSLLERIHEEEKRLVYEEGYPLLERKRGEESVLLFRIIAAVRFLYLASSPLIGLLLWRSRQDAPA